MLQNGYDLRQLIENLPKLALIKNIPIKIRFILSTAFGTN